MNLLIIKEPQEILYDLKGNGWIKCSTWFN